MSQQIAISPLTGSRVTFPSIRKSIRLLRRGQSAIASPPRDARRNVRGFEKILEGRDPLDAQQLTQDMWGLFPGARHRFLRAQEMAYGIKIQGNGRLIQNLMLAAKSRIRICCIFII